MAYVLTPQISQGRRKGQPLDARQASNTMNGWLCRSSHTSHQNHAALTSKNCEYVARGCAGWTILSGLTTCLGTAPRWHTGDYGWRSCDAATPRQISFDPPSHTDRPRALSAWLWRGHRLELLQDPALGHNKMVSRCKALPGEHRRHCLCENGLCDHATPGASLEQTAELSARRAEPHHNLVGVGNRVFDEVVRETIEHANPRHRLCAGPRSFATEPRSEGKHGHSARIDIHADGSSPCRSGIVVKSKCLHPLDGIRRNRGAFLAARRSVNRFAIEFLLIDDHTRREPSRRGRREAGSPCAKKGSRSISQVVASAFHAELDSTAIRRSVPTSPAP